MASIKLKHLSGNSTILHSPASNPTSDVTLKLPSTTGSAGQVLKVASANHSSTNAELEFGADTGGKILQVKNVVKTDTYTSNSDAGSYVSVNGLSVSITISDSSNKVLVIPSILMSADQGHRHGYRIVRGSTAICIADSAGNRTQSTSCQGNPPNDVMHYNHTNLFLDTPGVGTHTYAVQVRSESNGSGLYINRSANNGDFASHFRGTSQITVFEVAP